MIATATSSSSNSYGKLDSSSTFRGVVPSQHSTQCMTLIQEPQAHFIPTQPSPIDSQMLSLPSQPPALTVDPGSDSEEHDWSITFNSTRELDIEIVHTLVHEQMVHCVKFSRDGQYIAFGCGDGRAYIYDVQTGILTWSVNVSGNLRDCLLNCVSYAVSSKTCLQKTTFSTVYVSTITENILPLVHMMHAYM